MARAVVRLTVELPQELYGCLEEEARRRQASKAEVIRELLAQACKEGGKA
jgi:metal-responsive CopG/Arc/MetJ family transcriptional regulator